MSRPLLSSNITLIFATLLYKALKVTDFIGRVRVMVFNATFNNISVISW